MDEGTSRRSDLGDETPATKAPRADAEAVNRVLRVEVRRLRQQVDETKRQLHTPPTAALAVAVLGPLLRAEVKAAIQREKADKSRLTVANVNNFTPHDWLESHTAGMPDLSALVRAMELPWGKLQDGETEAETGAGHRVQRLTSVAGVLSCLMRALDLRFCTPMGHLQSFCLKAAAGSDQVVKVREPPVRNGW